MASKRKRNDIIMNMPATYAPPGVLAGQLGTTVEQTEPPIQAALGHLYKAIGTAQASQQTLENQVSSVCSCYQVNPFANPQTEEAGQQKQGGCMLEDQIMSLVRMVNSLVDRQEALSRNIQL